MISMAQLSRHRANAPALQNDFSVGHDGYVRSLRTAVNVENVRPPRQFAVMMGTQTLGDQLRRMQEQSGLTYDVIAKRAGYRGRSSVQRFFSSEYDPPYLPLPVAERLAKAFEGTEVGREPILALAGLPESNAKVVRYEGSSLETMRRDVPVFGTALGASQSFNGQAIEQTTLNTGEIIGYFQRPTVLNGRANVYGLYIQGSSMSPRYEHGESAFVERDKPPRIGDEVVVYIRDQERDDGESASGAMIKRLVRMTAEYVELEQFNPPVTFRVERARVVRIDRVIPWAELLS
jgi:phage repressor protein C with HTH and peptisase S24 domain